MIDLIEFFSGGSFDTVTGLFSFDYSISSPEFFWRVLMALFLMNALYMIINIFIGLKR